MKKQGRHISLTLLLTILIAVQIGFFQVGSEPTLAITVATNKPQYNQRDPAVISGGLHFGEDPISDVLVALQVKDPFGGSVAYRALSTGGTPTLDDAITIQGLEPIDPVTEAPRIYFKIGSQSKFRVTVANSGSETIALLTLTIFDGNMIPLGSTSFKGTIPSGTAPFTLQIPIDDMWAYIGPAKAVANVFSDYPSANGVPRCLETAVSFGIVRGDITTSSVPPPPPENLTSAGTFNTTIRLGADPWPGYYTVYVSAHKYSMTAVDTTSFQVKSSSLDVPSPPQASFTFSPLKAYVNAPVSFDARASSPENYNDSITGYEWDWSDGSPKNFTTSPLFTHKFASIGTYNVTLRVTDSTSWSVTSKPVTVGPPDPPVADFTWSPNPPIMNRTTMFNASPSQPGWNGTHNIPIVSYLWDFGDGNLTSVAVPIIYHTYAQNITYDVTLTVTDSGSLQDSQTYTIKVENRLVGDINGDDKVDGKDLAIAAKAFGTIPGDPLWDPRADVSGDGRVDGKDIAIIAKNFGQTLISGLPQDYSETFGIAVEGAFTTSTDSPPQASFAFSPLKKCVNTPIVFDASASSPENFDDSITGYEWDWGDGSPKNFTTSPLFTHKFASVGTYNVTLKVTDGTSWCITSKPVAVVPPDPPVADFTWLPDPPIVDRIASFDASLSQLGWNGTHSVPIVSYLWDFGDGNLTSVAVPIIYHTYAQNITYDVTLTVTDSGSLQDSQTYTIKVENRLVGDINGDDKVDGKDLAIAAKAFGTIPGDPLWDPRADVSGDGRVDGKDIAIIAKNFGQTL